MISERAMRTRLSTEFMGYILLFRYPMHGVPRTAAGGAGRPGGGSHL